MEALFGTLALVFLTALAVVSFIWEERLPGMRELIGNFMDRFEFRGKPPSTSGGVARRLERVRNAQLGAIAAYCYQVLIFFFVALLISSCSLVIVLYTIQPFLQAQDVEAYSSVVSLLLWCLLDALTFDLFTVLAMDVQPAIDSWLGRVVLWYFYVINASLLVRIAFSTLVGVLMLPLAFINPQYILNKAQEE